MSKAAQEKFKRCLLDEAAEFIQNLDVHDPATEAGRIASELGLSPEEKNAVIVRLVDEFVRRCAKGWETHE
jgi:transcription initiation factor TFIIIB Brf1 subunit/transcription initiation factor TFIIB